MRGKKIMKTKKPRRRARKTALFALAFCALPAAAGFFYFSKAEVLELRASPALQQAGGYRRARQKIEDYLKAYKGRAMGRISLKRITEDVSRIYPAAEVHAARRLPRRLTVFLSQGSPLLLLLKGKNVFYSVFSDGTVRAQRGWDQSLDFPLLRGKSFWRRAGLRKRAAALVSSLPKKGWLRSENISEILYNKKNDSFVFFLISKNFVLEAGDPMTAQKAKNISFVLNYLDQLNDDDQKEGESQSGAKTGRGQKNSAASRGGGYRINALLEKKIIVSLTD